LRSLFGFFSSASSALRWLAASSSAFFDSVSSAFRRLSEELEGAIAAAKAAGVEAIMTLLRPFFFQRKLIADLALKHKLPLAMSESLTDDAGALLQVDPDVHGCAARSATYSIIS
jgi:hypothetical protein